MFDYNVQICCKDMHSIVRIERSVQSAFNAGTAYCIEGTAYCIEGNGAVVAGRTAYCSSATNNDSSVILDTADNLSNCTTRPRNTA